MKIFFKRQIPLALGTSEIFLPLAREDHEERDEPVPVLRLPILALYGFARIAPEILVYIPIALGHIALVAGGHEIALIVCPTRRVRLDVINHGCEVVQHRCGVTPIVEIVVRQRTPIALFLREFLEVLQGGRENRGPVAPTAEPPVAK